MQPGIFQPRGASNSKPAPQTSAPYRQAKIDQARGEFIIDGYSVGKAITVVGLGLLRTRTMWPTDLQKRGGMKAPLCNSKDSITGIPTRHFPWHHTALTGPTEQLACDVCPFKSYSKSGPTCKQEWNVPFRFLEQNIHDAVYMLSFTASGIKNLEPYMKRFRDSATPFYYESTTITLKRRSGQNDNQTFSVPYFTHAGMTNPAAHLQFAYDLNLVREFMQPSQAVAAPGFSPNVGVKIV